MPVKKTNLTSIKKQLQAQELKETLNILGELYKLNRENKQFLDTRFSSSKEVLKEYIEAIKDALDPPLSKDMEVDFKSARKVISNYKKARKDDIKGIVELMLRFVENANGFTLCYGDMWEQFYINIETMYEKTIIEVKRWNEWALILGLCKSACARSCLRLQTLDGATTIRWLIFTSPLLRRNPNCLLYPGGFSQSRCTVSILPRRTLNVCSG
jgi:hypothetical protein